MVARFRPVPGSQVHPAHVEPATSDERPHPQFLGKDERLTHVVLRALEIPMITMEGHLGEEAQRVGPVPPLAMGISKSQGAFGGRQRVVHATAEEMGFAELSHPARLTPHDMKGRASRERLVDQGQSLGNAPG
jgi:hypothetical protein